MAHSSGPGPHSLLLGALRGFDWQEWRLPAADCIDRVRALEAMGRLPGVMDDRGKFIHVAPEELEGVAAFVERCGRVHVSRLVAESNRLVRMRPEGEGDGEAKAAAPEEEAPAVAW